MQINTLEDLQIVLLLLSEDKVKISFSISEEVVEWHYNKEKQGIEEYMKQWNPYTGEVKTRTAQRTVEELFNAYKDYPNLWENFSVFKIEAC